MSFTWTYLISLQFSIGDTVRREDDILYNTGIHNTICTACAGAAAAQGRLLLLWSQGRKYLKEKGIDVMVMSSAFKSPHHYNKKPLQLK